jgi:hypothetical protein
MKIGDRIYVRGYVDEIRKDTVIVRNNGGYFGTIPSEVIMGELPSAQPYTEAEIQKMQDLEQAQLDKAYELGRQSAQPEPLTDKEQRIFLAAMGREEKVCKQVDDECRDCREPYEDSLVRTCHEITRKVKGALWT